VRYARSGLFEREEGDVTYGSATAFMVDFGALATLKVLSKKSRDLGIGFAVRNAGILPVKYSTDEGEEGAPTPMQVRAGLGWVYGIGKSADIGVAVDAVFPNDGSFGVGAGVEARIARIFYLRAGYRIGEVPGLSLGVGAEYDAELFALGGNFALAPSPTGFDYVGSLVFAYDIYAEQLDETEEQVIDELEAEVEE
jgi:hypothetical protein